MKKRRFGKMAGTGLTPRNCSNVLPLHGDEVSGADTIGFILRLISFCAAPAIAGAACSGISR